MYNQGLYNTTTYNGIPIANSGGLVDSDIRFNNLALQSSNIILNQPKYDKPANFITDKYKYPQKDGYGQNTKYLGIKTITLNGIIKTDSSVELEDLIDLVNNELNGSGNLDIKRADGTYRRFVVDSVDVGDFRGESYHKTWCEFNAVFNINKGMGEDTLMSSSGAVVEDLVYNGVQTCNTVGRDVKTPLNFVLAVDSASDVTKINIKNNTNDNEIELVTALSAGDLLFIDADNLECYKVSGGIKTRIVPRGRYIKMEIGANNYTITVTGTSIKYTLTAKHTNLYV